VSQTLTSAQQKKAKSRANPTGRSYPNLVDSMRVAAERQRRKKTPKVD